MRKYELNDDRVLMMVGMRGFLGLLCLIIFSAMQIPADSISKSGLSDVWQEKVEEHYGSETEKSDSESGLSDSKSEQNDPEYEAVPDANADGSSDSIFDDTSDDTSGKQYNRAYQMTEDDILALNNGNATILYSEEGYLSFLRGKYYEEKVLNAEDGIQSLNGMATMLGLTKGAEFFAVYSESNVFGYTFYIYQQRYGDLTLENAVLKVIVGPDGYTAGLVSSFTPNVGMAPENEKAVTAGEAQEIVRSVFEGEPLHIYEDYTRQTSVTVQGVAYHAWAVFTDMPATLEDDPESGNAGQSPNDNGGQTGRKKPPQERPYMEHLVAYDGSYLMHLPVSSPEELVLGDNAQAALPLEWFEGKEADTWTGMVTTHDGSQKKISVPVVRDEAGTYYLADAQRHILLTDYRAYVYDHSYQPRTSDDNSGWPDRYLLVYDTMIRVYDFFAEYGMISVDGFGAPILIMTDYADALGTPIDNACFQGFTAGWALFAFSALNDFGESLDVVAHEFTHGITTYALGGDLYINESGALNEALSDILGNLCERMIREENVRENNQESGWEIGEDSGQVIRDMSFPWLYGQPVMVGGRYYAPEEPNPNLGNDFGGVHTNSSIIAHIAWELSSLGLSDEDSLRLWTDAINFLTPYSGYKQMHYALEFACEMRGLDIEWFGKLHMVFEQAGVE